MEISFYPIYTTALTQVNQKKNRTKNINIKKKQIQVTGELTASLIKTPVDM